MAVMTGLSGNEMFCLHQKGIQAGNLVIGNSVFSIGLIGSIGSGIKTLVLPMMEQLLLLIYLYILQYFQPDLLSAKKYC